MTSHKLTILTLAATLLLLGASRASAAPANQCTPPHVSKIERLIEDYRDAFNSHDPAALAAVMPANYWSLNPLGEFNGQAANLALAASFFGAFPDMHYTIVRVVVQGDRVVLEYTWTGTHLGEVLGIAPTGRIVQGRGVEVHEVENYRLARTWNYSDIFGLLAQLQAE